MPSQISLLWTASGFRFFLKCSRNSRFFFFTSDSICITSPLFSPPLTKFWILRHLNEGRWQTWVRSGLPDFIHIRPLIDVFVHFEKRKEQKIFEKVPCHRGKYPKSTKPVNMDLIFGKSYKFLKSRPNLKQNLANYFKIVQSFSKLRHNFRKIFPGDIDMELHGVELVSFLFHTHLWYSLLWIFK